MYAYEFPGMGFATEDMFDVLGMRNRYRKFLRDGGTVGDYMALLDEIGGIYPSARRFIEANLDLLAHDQNI